MASTIGDIFRELDFNEYHQILLDNSYYDVLFPFLLVFAVLYTVLSLERVKLFRSKKTNEPYKSVIFIVSFILSYFGVSFEISDGYNLGSLFMMMFPNISALTMGILALYVVGSILGKDFFRGLFDKDHGAYAHFAIGVIGLGAIVFYLGIVFGLWDYNYLDPQSYWNIVIAVALLIMGVVFMIIGLFVPGAIMLLVLGTFIYNYGDGNILEYFIDPVIFIAIIVIGFVSWLGKDKNPKERLRSSLIDSERSIQKYIDEYRKEHGREPRTYDSKIYDIMEKSYRNNVHKWNKKYPGEKW